ncbi:helix-turn-helix domain-containing protein [Streptomyces arenae]|uniref:helix-turn-helix domain-containing protein n=1 Tax=Streptomyces arenae TaxID=29301 RepID=UPI002659557F|nr:XRE family transcriptional regulator [Streptomyces arenae]MCG7205101.1 XRE family transcriptional regulator [Streptomyces arenae]
MSTHDAAAESSAAGGSGRGAALGPRLRTAREQNGMSLRELARRLGCSPSHVSQIERGLAAPSVSVLYSMVAELGLSMDGLFQEGDEGLAGGRGGAGANAPAVGRASASAAPAARTGDATGDARAVAVVPGEERFVQRAATRRAIEIESGMRWELLTPSTEHGVDFREIVYEVGAGSAPGGQFIRHAGREYGLVLEGHLHLQIGFERFVLGPGDSVAFDSTLPHRLWNEGEGLARAAWFSLADPGARP